MKNHGRTLLFYAALAASSLSLQGCAATSTTVDAAMVGGAATANTIFHRKDVNLREKNYAAADYMVQQIESYIPRGAPMYTEELSLVREPAITSKLGRVIPVEVGARLRELGYNVILPDDNLPVRTGSYLIGGTYDRIGDVIAVHLRVKEVATGRVIGSFNYTMPTNSDLRKLSEPEAIIYRVAE